MTGPILVLGLILWFFPGSLTNKIIAKGDGDAAPKLVAYNVSDHLPEALRTTRSDVPAAPR